MKLSSEQFEINECSREMIFTYLDGELSASEELALEFHIAECKSCREELNSQKQVSTTLEILLEKDEKDFELPAGFSKTITANAESNLENVRSPKERSKALFICVLLGFLVLIGYGTKLDSLWMASEKFATQIMAVGGFIGHLFYTLAVGTSVIFGFLSHRFVVNSLLTLTLLAVFICSSLILSRLVFRYNRS